MKLQNKESRRYDFNEFYFSFFYTKMSSYVLLIVSKKKGRLKMGKQLTDKEKVNQIFKSLRQAGYAAEQNYTCCSTCGWSEIEDDYGDVEKVVFYHRQDADSFKGKMLERPLYLAWAGDGDEIVRIIEENGMSAEWKGTEQHRIAILPSSC